MAVDHLVLSHKKKKTAQHSNNTVHINFKLDLIKI